MSLIAGTYGFFQFAMPMIGWLCVHTIVEYFKKLENETGAGVEDGMHVVFGMVVVPFVTKAVKEDFEKIISESNIEI